MVFSLCNVSSWHRFIPCGGWNSRLHVIRESWTGQHTEAMSHRPLLAVSSLVIVSVALAGCALFDNHRALTLEIVVNAE